MLPKRRIRDWDLWHPSRWKLGTRDFTPATRLITAVTIAAGVGIVALAFWSQVGANDVLHQDNTRLQDDNARLVTQVNELSAVNQCRSVAAIFADSTAAVQDGIVALGLSAVGRGQSTAPYADALDVARANTAAALDAREVAATECAKNPHYRIDPSILKPLPPIPGD